MILYFSGTGNSRFVAEAIKSIIDDEVISINELIKNNSNIELKSDKPFVFVTPTYAWQMPKVVDDFIRNTKFIGNSKAYFVLTCGGSVGNAAHFAKKICTEKGFEFFGLAPIIMPDNYVVMYPVPDKTKSEKIINKAEPHIFNIAETIKNNKHLAEENIGLINKMQSGFVNSLFYSMFVSAKGFHTNDKCVSCTKCVKLCPLNNIVMENQKPKWGNNCTHCMACICGCPTEAIEYKNKTKGKDRYYNTKRI